jgi:hypothetical protein
MAQPELTPSASQPTPEPSPAGIPRSAPPRPRSHRQELFTQLVIVTAGVLIALLLEGLVQWSQHRTLAREAEANIRAELRENMGRLDHFFEKARTFGEERKQLRKLIDALLARRLEGKPIEGSRDYSLNYRLTQLTAAAWQTAGATGALGHMSYATVKNYAQAYYVQAEFEQLQGELLRLFARTTMHGLDPDEMTLDELRTCKENLSGVESTMRLQEGLAHALRKQIYPGVLGDIKTNTASATGK